MTTDDRAETLTKAIKRHAFPVSHDDSESSETAHHCTMFILGAAAFGVGFWAVTCLLGALLKDGPLMMLKNLTAAVTGF